LVKSIILRGNEQLKKNQLASVEAVFFDADGTLLTFSAPVALQYAQVLKRFDMILDVDILDQTIRIVWQRMYGQYLNEANGFQTSADREYAFWQTFFYTVCKEVGCNAVPDTAFDAIYTHFATLAARPLHQDAHAVISALKATGLSVGILSNHDARIKQLISASSIAPLLDVIFTVTDTGFKKPSQNAFRHVEHFTGLEPRALLYVGNDYCCDYQGARAAGWQAFLIDAQRAATGEVDMLNSLTELSHVLSDCRPA
jgi:REG-2-like HAD superfamily hydrolase